MVIVGPQLNQFSTATLGVHPSVDVLSGSLSWNGATDLHGIFEEGSGWPFGDLVRIHVGLDRDCGGADMLAEFSRQRLSVA